LALGRMLVALAPRAGDRALVVGCGTGYAAAVLARLAGEVVAVEEAPALVAAARANLAGLGSVEIVEGPLTAGSPEHGPYDIILIDGAVAAVPDALVDQLAEDGRLATALDEDGVTRLAVGRRRAGAFGLARIADTEAAALPGFAAPAAFRF
jgi:protein-L-isoaspartate(D-aspartate) O-methyltransferase